MKLTLQSCTGKAVAAAGLCAVLASTFSHADDRYEWRGSDRAGAVYTATNATDGNAIVSFKRASDGSLTPAGRFPTGGVGTGAGLGNQGGLTLSEDGRWLISVNAGSDDLTVFSVERGGLKKVQTIRSGGIRPVSVTVDDDLVYVLNAGSDNLSGFRMNYKGQLQPVAGSTRPLSGTGTNPAQIAFSPDGNNLVVTEKTTNKLVVYSVDRSGLPEQLPQIVPSPGQTPFGFSFANRRQLLVSEAAGGAPNGSSVSSYRLGRDSMLTVVAGAVPTNQTAACWIEVTPSGRYAYATNTGSSSVSGYRVRYSGDISLLNDDGVTASTGEASRPIDLGITRDGRFLYTLNSGNQTLGMFKIKSDGSLESLGSIGGIPEGANGLVAR